MKIFTSVFFLAIPSLVIGQQTSHEEHVRRVIAYMRTAILVTILAGLNPLLLAQSHASDANRTRSLHVATFKAKDGALTIDEIAGARKLSLYDDAGHFDCRRFTQEAIYKRREEEKVRIASAMKGARDFIWQHWQSKKCGYIRITFNSVDATSTSHIFIEPDSSGVWQVMWRIVRHNNEWTICRPFGLLSVRMLTRRPFSCSVRLTERNRKLFEAVPAGRFVS